MTTGGAHGLDYPARSRERREIVSMLIVELFRLGGPPADLYGKNQLLAITADFDPLQRSVYKGQIIDEFSRTEIIDPLLGTNTRTGFDAGRLAAFFLNIELRGSNGYNVGATLHIRSRV